ncbi:peptidase [Candidatus Thiodiazotropha endoloripes]|uniref:BtrH N-terminal domain-containing protein n=1 Tax=Candidatus Thiodiazotropha endoloripes TaxID=1818881 RepID=UPI00083D1450|nr:BtrH N-terminal domain-containing protein [Candidatus Thiodiazotropha endoloripes]ODB91576.1 peptidase [Candidatus Thiodiazotropha endoloripes]
MNKPLEHRHAAHCETGVMSAMLRYHGLEVSEPMAFGLASGLTYAYIPMVKINGMPLIAYRTPPRMIIRALSRRIGGLKMTFQKFRKPAQGEAALDRLLDDGRIVGLQTSVFFLPYFPEDMRFHFNAHNLLVYGREGEAFQVSDPVFSHLVTVDRQSLTKARFAKGALAPKGLLYYPAEVPAEIDFKTVLPKAIRFTAKINGKRSPVPIAGSKGIQRVAGNIRKLVDAETRYAHLYLGHIVRMQEEIGTGGGGFRFMYAAFLQEAAELLASDQLAEAADEMSSIGDAWRLFALMCARKSKARYDDTFDSIADQLDKIALREGALFARLSALESK